MRAIAFMLLACLAAAAQEDPKAADRKKADELLKGVETRKGFLTMHLKESTVLAELGKGEFGSPFLLFESIARGVGRGRALGGMTLGERIVSWRKVSDAQIQLVEENPRFRAAPGSPLDRAVQNSYARSVLATFPVLARHPDRETFLIDLGALFLTDLPGVGEMLKGALGAEYRHDKASSSWEAARSFPDNVSLVANLAFSSAKYTDAETVPDSRSVEVGVHYGMQRLPAGDYRPREADDRVGYFLTAIKDFSQPGLTSWRRWCNRWRIEKADPKAEMSPPRDPLVFWIENTVPFEYRRHVRDGILEWNKAFERIGIRDAIEVRQMEENADWDPEDSRYNTFRWITSSRLSFGAMGPSRVDPRTGQILDADILFEADNLRGVLWSLERNNLPRTGRYFLAEAPDEACGHGGLCFLGALRAPECALAETTLALMGAAPIVLEEYLGQAIKETVMHEVGHTLGLRHNFKASMMLTLEQMQDKELVAREGLMGSVMEYNSVNISRDPARQGYYYSPTLGPYDYWAIEYGYRPLDAEQETEALRRIASRCGEPGLSYATDEDTYGPTNIDPEATVFDGGSDPLAWCRDRIGLCEDVWAKDWAPLHKPGHGYRLYRGAMLSTLRGYRQGLEIAARWVGGTVMNRRHPGDAGEPFRSIPLARQREALEFVLLKGFAPGLLQFSPERLNRLAPNRFRHWGTEEEGPYEFPLREEVRSLRRALLDRFHAPAVLHHIVEAQARAPGGEPSMTVGELLSKVKDAVWAEVRKGQAQAIEPYRRDLQADHAEALIGLLFAEEAPRDARNIARSLLLAMATTCAQAAGGGDLETRSHLEAVEARIRKVLDAAVVMPAR